MGEFKVHRVRFFDYMPTAIRAMAFNAHTERLALARMDGSVEIFNFTDHYFQEKVSRILSYFMACSECKETFCLAITFYQILKTSNLSCLAIVDRHC